MEFCIILKQTDLVLVILLPSLLVEPFLYKQHMYMFGWNIFFIFQIKWALPSACSVTFIYLYLPTIRKMLLILHSWYGCWIGDSWHATMNYYAAFWLSRVDVIKWKYFPRYWPFMRGIHQSPAQRPMTRSFDVFFDLRLKDRVSKMVRLVIWDAIAPIMASQ